MHRINSLYKTSVTSCVYMSSGPKKQNYYDVLKIRSNATQNEVKVAYYDMSKKYHPDKNQSENAKEKFRKVAEAYEVLGNHDSRRNYDRLMSIRGSVPDKGSYTYRKSSVVTDPRMRAYREKAESYGTGASYTFNYDEWTRAHYGQSFTRSKRLKQKEKVLNEEISTASQANNIIIEKVVLSAIIFLLTSVIIHRYLNDYDTPKAVKKIEKNDHIVCER